MSNYSLIEIKKLALDNIKKSNLKKEDKLQLLQSLKESDEYRTMEFLNVGQFLREDMEIDSEMKQDIREQFNSNMELLDEATGGSVMGIILAPYLWVAWRTLAGLSNKERRKCGMYKISKDYHKCILENVYIKQRMQQINILKKVKCNESKKPEKCQKSVAKAIKKLDNEIKGYQKKLRALQGVKGF